MRHLLFGLAVLLFGMTVGGIGIATAGIGIGIPMIPIGLYLTYRGWRIYRHSKFQTSASKEMKPLELFEKTKLGKIGLGILFVLVGIGTSAMLVGIPFFAFGIWLICTGVDIRIRLKKLSQSKANIID